MLAVWLMFEKKDKMLLKNIIKNLSKKYGSQIFLPHMTLYGPTNISFSSLQKIVLDTISDINSFYVVCESIGYSNTIWKSIFIKLENSKELKSIFIKISKNLKQFKQYFFEPHVSLIYKKLKISEKQSIITQLTIPNEFKINSISILKYSKNIEDWKILKTYYLNN